jgi:hypothetical protein
LRRARLVKVEAFERGAPYSPDSVEIPLGGGPVLGVYQFEFAGLAIDDGQSSLVDSGLGCSVIVRGQGQAVTESIAAGNCLSSRAAWARGTPGISAVCGDLLFGCHGQAFSLRGQGEGRRLNRAASTPSRARGAQLGYW